MQNGISDCSSHWAPACAIGAGGGGGGGGGGSLEVCWAMGQVRGVEQDLPCDAG